MQTLAPKDPLEKAFWLLSPLTEEATEASGSNLAKATQLANGRTYPTQLSCVLPLLPLGL